MHELTPHDRWLSVYDPALDPDSPFFGKEYNYDLYSDNIYGYFIDPAWDFMGSETTYLKILCVDDDDGFAIIQFIGEWNDALHNDIMYLKRNVIDPLINRGIDKFILVGDYVFNFHGSDDCYYEEWNEEIGPNGWIVAINFREFVAQEWRKFGLDAHMNFGEMWNLDSWRTLSPIGLFGIIQNRLQKALN